MDEIKLNNIYCMDCLEGMKNLEDNSVDCVITDPPYNINLKPQRRINKSIDNDNLSNKEFKTMLNGWFQQIDRVLKNDSFLIIFVGWSTIPDFREVLDKYFFLKSMPIWVKNNFGIGYYTRPQYEPLMLYLKGKPPVLKNPISDVMKFNKVLKPVHSCEKPVMLIKHLVNSFSKKNEIVLDPFMGSGTTAVAAKELGRNFIGFELDDEYCKIAEERIKKVVKNKSLFDF
ncbi:MAG: DNA-methyltransferase [bacterium]